MENKNVKIKIIVLLSVIVLIGLGRSFYLNFPEILNYANYFKASLLPEQPFFPKLEESGVVEEDNIIEEQVEEQAKEDEELKVASEILSKSKESEKPLSLKEQIDNIAEKMDVINRQIEDLVKGNQGGLEQTETESTGKEDDQEETENKQTEDEIENENLNENKTATNNQSSSGSGKTVYPKILISEVKTSGQTDAKDEFIELYNPNNSQVDLTGWYIQRKTATSENWASFASKNLFEGRSIPENGYFLVSRSGYNISLADIFVDSSITDDNSFALKDPNGEVSDKLGFGNAKDPELLPAQNPLAEQSIGRMVLENGEEQETNDNSTDFELQIPTPKEKNIKWSETPEEDPINDLIFIQKSLSFDINIEITDLLGTVSPSGIAGYVFRWKESQGNWQEDPLQEVLDCPAIYSVKRNFTGENNKTYIFQARATDCSGNQSEWLPDSAVETRIELSQMPESMPVVINEIQTKGTTAKDEFIELYNPNNFNIDLANFALKKKTAGGAESNLVSLGSFSGVISALGYFLIVPQLNENQTPNYTGSAVPNLYYSGKTYAISQNNTVLLYSNGSLIDKVGWGEAHDFETSPAQNPQDSKSISRVLGADTNNNNADFITLDLPTPGS